MKKYAPLMLALCASLACAQEDNWSAPQQPFKIYGNTHYVGTAGISAVLVTSPQGHILVDATTTRGAGVVADNIRALGYQLHDVKYILSTHAHEDHAGGLAELQQLTGATVVAGAADIAALHTGVAPDTDPQYGTLPVFPAVANVLPAVDGQVIQLGSLAMRAHATPGHTPGGLSWSWRSCGANGCHDMTFLNSVTAVAAPGFRFSSRPDLVATFRHTFDAVSKMPCEIAIAAHPEANDLWGRKRLADRQGVAAFIDTAACQAVADAGRRRLDAQLTTEQAKR